MTSSNRPRRASLTRAPGGGNVNKRPRIYLSPEDQQELEEQAAMQRHTVSAMGALFLVRGMRAAKAAQPSAASTTASKRKAA